MISFDVTDEQSQIRDMLLAFAKEELAPRARQADETCAAPAELLDEAWSLGLASLAIPEAYGGGGAPRSALTGALMLEAMGSGCAGLGGTAAASSLFVNPLIDLGSEEQKKRELPKFCGNARRAATLALHEDSFAFDPSRIVTRAEPRADGWRITGVKRLVPLGEEAGDMLVLARASDAPGIDRIKAFIVPPRAPALGVARSCASCGVGAWRLGAVFAVVLGFGVAGLA